MSTLTKDKVVISKFFFFFETQLTGKHIEYKFVKNSIDENYIHQTESIVGITKDTTPEGQNKLIELLVEIWLLAIFVIVNDYHLIYPEKYDWPSHNYANKYPFWEIQVQEKKSCKWHQSLFPKQISYSFIILICFYIRPGPLIIP